MFKNEGGGGGKGRLNNVQKNRRFGPAGRPLVCKSGFCFNVFVWLMYLPVNVFAWLVLVS